MAPPNVEKLAQWLVGESRWGFLTTLWDMAPSGYVASYSDVDGASISFLYLSAFDQSGKNIARDDMACLTMTELAVDSCGGTNPPVAVLPQGLPFRVAPPAAGFLVGGCKGGGSPVLRPP